MRKCHHRQEDRRGDTTTGNLPSCGTALRGKAICTVKRACGLVSGPEPQRAVGDRGQEEYSDTLSLKKSLPEAGAGRGLGAADLHCPREAKAERPPGNNGPWASSTVNYKLRAEEELTH